MVTQKASNDPPQFLQQAAAEPEKSEFASLMEMPAQFARLDEVAKLCSQERLAGMASMRRAYTSAKGVELMRKLLDHEMMAVFMTLMDTPIGFRTDHGPGCKDKSGKQLPPYSEAVVKDCLIQAFMRGVEATGNQFNIIAWQAYITKEGFTHKIKLLQNVKSVKMTLDVPRMTGSGAIVKSAMSWEANGAEDEVVREFPIRVNAGMGADAILGKAERKIKAAAFYQMTGSDPLPEGEVGDEPLATPEATRSSLADVLKCKTQKLTSPNGEPDPSDIMIDQFARICDMKHDEAESYLNGKAQDMYAVESVADMTFAQLNDFQKHITNGDLIPKN